MKTLAIGRTKSDAYWVFMFNTREEALVFIDTANNTPVPNHEVWETHWDLVLVKPTTVAEAIAEFKLGE